MTNYMVRISQSPVHQFFHKMEQMLYLRPLLSRIKNMSSLVGSSWGPSSKYGVQSDRLTSLQWRNPTWIPSRAAFGLLPETKGSFYFMVVEYHQDRYRFHASTGKEPVTNTIC